MARRLAVIALAVSLAACGYRTDDRGMTALMRAAEAGDAAAVTALIARGDRVDARVHAGLVYQVRVFMSVLSFFGEGPPHRDPGYTALMYAAERGHCEIVELLLAAGADPNAQDLRDMRALHIALVRREPSPRLVEALLRAGSDVDGAAGFAYRRWTPLMYAAASGDAESVRMLLDAGAAKDAVDGGGFSALMLAARAGHEAAVRALLAAGAEREARDRTAGRSALDWANEDRHAAVVALLRATGASTVGLDDQALLRAIAERKLDHARSALAAGARADARTAQGETALFFAASHGFTAVVPVLLEAGADVHYRHRIYGSPLTSASDGGHDDIVRHLLAAGARANTPGEKALERAAVGGRTGIVDQLLAAGADPNAGQGAVLREACRGGDAAIVARLLAHGARPDLHTDTSTTALIQASLRGDAEMVRLLLAAGANPNVVDHVDYSALWSAAALGHGDVVRLLLAAGADRSHRKDGQTPEQAALRGGHGGVAEQLRDGARRS